MPAIVGAPSPTERFVNRGSGAIYDWPRNHSAEDAIRGLGRRLTRGGQSANIRMMRHPAHPGPVILALHGFLTDTSPPTGYDEFVTFFGDCDTTTFDFTDWRGDSYEVLITQFDARRQIDVPDGSLFQYDMQLVVLSINQSPLTVYFQ